MGQKRSYTRSNKRKDRREAGHKSIDASALIPSPLEGGGLGWGWRIEFAYGSQF
jgi:hypothetical protein